MKNIRYLIIFFFIIFSLNILYSQEIFFANFDQNHLQELNLKILEKDYIQREAIFKSYLLDFPKINFNISIDDQNQSNYSYLVLKYSSLPLLEEEKIITCNYNLDENTFKKYTSSFEKYFFSNTDGYKKCVYLKVKYLDKIEEFVFISIYLKDNPLIDFVKKDQILNSNKQLNQLEGFLYYDQNISYLISYNNYHLFNKNPYEIKKIVPTVILKEVIVKKEKNYFSLFILVLAVLFLLYDIFYFDLKYTKKTMPFLKKQALILKKRIISFKKKLFKQ